MVGILVGPKGRGSNMAAIVRAGFPITAVIAPVPESPALEVARGLGAPTTVVEYGDDYGQRLIQALDGATLLCLAGFMRLLPQEVLEKFPNRVLNIHPSLLPRFGGKGMYGKRVHEAVIAAGETESGCTVHRVTEHYDEGQIVLQAKCPVLPEDDADSLAARVLELEHRTYVEAIRQTL